MKWSWCVAYHSCIVQLPSEHGVGDSLWLTGWIVGNLDLCLSASFVIFVVIVFMFFSVSLSPMNEDWFIFHTKVQKCIVWQVQVWIWLGKWELSVGKYVPSVPTAVFLSLSSPSESEMKPFSVLVIIGFVKYVLLLFLFTCRRTIVKRRTWRQTKGSQMWWLRRMRQSVNLPNDVPSPSRGSTCPSLLSEKKSVLCLLSLSCW